MDRRLLGAFVPGALSLALLSASAAGEEFHANGRWSKFERLDSRLTTSPERVPIRFAGSEATSYLTSEIVVGVDDERALETARSQSGFVAAKELAVENRAVLVRYGTPDTALAAANALIGKPGVRYAHPDFVLPLEARSALNEDVFVAPETEPLFADQWNLHNTGQNGGTTGADLNVLPAWQLTTGNPDVIVADIDLGFEQAHPDLKDAWYVNPRETAGNRRDDDGNGLVDDVSGWNYATPGNNLIYGMNAGHGTATAGVIGARANGEGVTGICPRCKVLPLVIDEKPSNAAQAFQYAKAMGASVITNSWGYAIGTPRTDVVVEAIKTVAETGRGGKGISIVFAMSNFGRNDCRGPEPDISSHANVIAVSSADNADRKVTDAGYGPCLKLIAPSSGSTAKAVPTTDRPGERGFNTGANADDFSDLSYTKTFYGTSAATPQVAGVLALIYSLRPDLKASVAQAALLDSADKVQPSDAAYDVRGHSQRYGFGRVNAGKALEAASSAD